MRNNRGHPLPLSMVDREATGLWRRRRLDGLGARVDDAGYRGEGGDRDGGLTGGKGVEGWPESGWRLGSKGGGAPAFPRRREAMVYVRLDVAVLLETLVGSGEQLRRRTEVAASSAMAGEGARAARRDAGARARNITLYRGANTEVPWARTPRRGGGCHPGLSAWHAMAMALGGDGLRRAWWLGRSGPGSRRDGSGLRARPN
jgi:hypothetical protein